MLIANRNATLHVNSDPDLGSRETSMTYPNGTVLSYNYGSSGSLDDVIGRLDNIAEGSLTLQSYQYLGLSTVVVQDDVETGIELTYLYQSGDIYANFDGGDQYTGLDRFGRVIDQNYFDTGTSDSVERYQYTYDRDSNVTAKNNLVAEATGGVGTEFDETYTYDDLNRLVSDTRGGVAYQSWNLDSVGNMSSITTGGTTQENTVNSQNELTAAGSATLGFDNNGNTTTDDHGDTLIYDAWNRLVEVKNSGGGAITTYAYDGLNRLITDAPAGGPTVHRYYSNQGQALEVHHDGDTVSQYVWDAGTCYVNQMVLRDAFSGGTFSYRIYALQDANYNVTALVAYDPGTSTWNVAQRYVYDAYGTFLTLDEGFAPTSDAYTWKYNFQGMRYDVLVGWYNDSARIYSPTLQRFGQQDPMGYVDGANTYRFVADNPINLVDPTGLRGSAPAGPTVPSMTAPIADVQTFYNDLAALSRSQGHNWAADNLLYFLSNKGGTVTYPSTLLRSFNVVTAAEAKNQGRFMTRLVAEAKKLPSGGTTTFEDYWDALVEASTFTELFYASGTSTLRSRGKFTLTKTGSCVTVKGEVEHDWYDTYDWNPGQGANIPGVGWVPDDLAIRLVTAKVASNFVMRSYWHQDISGTYTINNWWFNSNGFKWGAVVDGRSSETFTSKEPGVKK